MAGKLAVAALSGGVHAAYLATMSVSRPPAPRSSATAGKGASPLTAQLEAAGLVLLFDGTCALCHGTVKWILRRDRTGTMRFAPLDSDLGREALRRLPSLAGVDSVVLLHREGAWIKSTAVLEIARYVGGIWSLALVGYLLPRSWRDALYDYVARTRYARFGRAEMCDLPTPETRQRFID
jgi:predicted DCC family thiol-disulfide oxidoreductase YuxK